MALLDSEIAAIKWHLGYNILTVGAEPYIGFASLFDQVIQPYVQAGAATTSTTTVTEATEATPVTLTLASATGFTAGARVVVDVDSRQEIATVQAVSGSTITLMLIKAHTGTYPVTVEGGETIVRYILGRLRDVQDQIQTNAVTTAGLKRVEDIEWYNTTGSSSSNITLSALGETLTFWRRELAVALGVEYLRDYVDGGGGSEVVNY